MRLLSFLMVLTFIWSCTEEPMEPVIVTSTIVVECSEPKGTAFGVEQDLVFSISLNTAPSVGINNFTIEKGSEELFSKSDYTVNIVEFSFGYKTTAEDLAAGSVPFIFTLVDGNNATKTQQIDVEVAVDLSVFVPEIAPTPAWDFFTDQSLTDTLAANADLYQYVVVIPFNTTFYWTSATGTKFYEISQEDDIALNYFDFNLPYSALQEAIEGLPAVDTVVISESTLPVIVQLGRNDELILVDRSNIQGSMVGYRRRDF